MKVDNGRKFKMDVIESGLKKPTINKFHFVDRKFLLGKFSVVLKSMKICILNEIIDTIYKDVARRMFNDRVFQTFRRYMSTFIDCILYQLKKHVLFQKSE